MTGIVYDYKKMPGKLHRWFVAYNDRMGRYCEENFDTKREAVMRIKALEKRGCDCELYTRERSLPESRLRKV